MRLRLFFTATVIRKIDRSVANRYLFLTNLH